MSKSKTQASRATSADLKSLAAQGVARALEARAGLAELSAEQVQQVSGGLTVSNYVLDPSRYGVWPAPYIKNIGTFLPGGINTLPGGFNPVVGP